ncbi:O-methyltransferase [Lutibacter sp.]|uniref:O-methyltransferase n=1 Tax=Lutibacter sp. TaxID=1925666 RepID=UPI002736B2F0|nr:class I SAM-dependent methyltransferase [Lutibacter sp.]MDP3312361.1 class I SAM-dependent methyltransferase [Lutibacter sp.]
MWFQVFSYFKFLIKSTNQHGIHSPFIYDLVTKCFYKNADKTTRNSIKNVIQFLKSNPNTIDVIDYGSGSKVFKNNRRKIGLIAVVAGSSLKKAIFLAKLVNYLKPKSILEIGTSVGIGTSALSFGYPKSKITTIEGCSNTAKIAQETFNHFGLTSIELKIGQFEQVLPEILENQTFNCIFFDGNHKKNPTLNYFELCLKNAETTSVFIFDDIYYSKEMYEAWNIIKKNPNVSVTINTYYFGIVFFKKEQTKQHFTVRI